MDTLYNGAATVGRIKAYGGVVVATIVGIILIIAGVIVAIQPASKNTVAATGTVSAVTSCAAVAGDTPAQYACALQVSYTYSGTGYSEALSITSPTSYAVNDSIAILIDPNTPTSITNTAGISTVLIGVVLIGLALLIMGLSWLTLYLTRKSKAFSALQGVGVGLGAVEDLVRR
jgi:hypothetical protein